MITIIIPVWNASKTITRCIESIQAQTFTDWEIILSDDGAQDHSLAICRTIAERYNL